MTDELQGIPALLDSWEKRWHKSYSAAASFGHESCIALELETCISELREAAKKAMNEIENEWEWNSIQGGGIDINTVRKFLGGAE